MTMTQPGGGDWTADVNPAAAELTPAPRTGRWVSLAAINASHMEFLYHLATDEETGFRWLLSGVVPPPDVFMQNLWKGVLTQFVVLEHRTSRPIGVVVGYNAEIQHSFCYMGGAFVPAVQKSGLGIEALDTFLTYLFLTYSFRKIYMEVPEYNLPSIGHLAQGIIRCEGRMREHTYYAGRYWDRIIGAVYRDEFLGAPRSRHGRRLRTLDHSDERSFDQTLVSPRS